MTWADAFSIACVAFAFAAVIIAVLYFGTKD